MTQYPEIKMDPSGHAKYRWNVFSECFSNVSGTFSAAGGPSTLSPREGTT